MAMVEIQCQGTVCDVKFKVPAYRAETAKFHSHKCRTGLKGRRKEWIKKKCEGPGCEVEFEVLPHRSSARFHDQKCFGKWQSEQMRGQPALNQGSRKSKTRSDSVKRAWTPEKREAASERMKERWAEEDGAMQTRKTAEQRRVSNEELSLAVHLDGQGYKHNTSFFVTFEGKRRLPDYVDVEGRRVVEYFGSFWHPKEHEQEYKDWYRSAGWECTVIWDYQLSEYL